MARKKRKKHPKLPNGFGSIKFLGENRRNCYAVHPPTKEFKLNGSPVTPKAICYVDDWMKGFTVLVAWKAGTYTEGMEKELEIADANSLEDLSEKILADYSRITRPDANKTASKTFAEVYKDFFAYKYERPNGRKYSPQSINSTQAAYKNCSVLHNRPFDELKHMDLQNIIDESTLKYASLELIVSLFKQMYRYAKVHDIVEKNYSSAVQIGRPDEEEHGAPFSENDLKTLWAHKEDAVVELILIACYSGFRISAYKTMEVNLRDNYFRGGVKNKFSKDRIVPIHSSILPLVQRRYKRDKSMLAASVTTFRAQMYEVLNELGIERHTPHDCRHTFSKLCEDFNVRENDRKRMLGHSFGGDITNQVYGHRSVADLRTEIEKIRICY